VLLLAANREHGQAEFLDAARKFGAIAAFITDAEQANALLA